MRQYCTVFDSKYLPRGLVLISTLVAQSSKKTHINVLSLDYKGTLLLRKIAERFFPNVEVWTLDEVSSPEMIKARGNRTYQEFCWTMASYFSNFLFEKRSYSEMTYLDSDMMFYGDPEKVHDELQGKAIGIIPHRLIPEKKHLECNGIFNVSWVTFKSLTGRQCCKEWSQQCLEWCYARVEPERFGDQKYLDAWPAKYG